MKLKKNSLSTLAAGIFVCATSLGLAATASAETVLSAITSTGKITVATEVAYPPMEFLKGGKVVGYGKDVLDLIVAELDVELNQLQLPWDGILAGVLAKKYDMVATSVVIKPERVIKYAFTRPLAIGETMLVQRTGDGMSSLDDVNGKIIGVELGSSLAQEVDIEQAKMKAAGKEGFSKISGFKSTDDMRLALASGQIDIGAITSFSLAPMQKQRPGVFEKLTIIGEGSLFSWVTHPENTALRDRLNEILVGLENKGKLETLQMKWFGYVMDLPTENYLPEGAI